MRLTLAKMDFQICTPVHIAQGKVNPGLEKQYSEQKQQEKRLPERMGLQHIS
jgi:hypothetical protein